MKKIKNSLRNIFTSVAIFLTLVLMLSAGRNLTAFAARLPYTPYCACVCGGCADCSTCPYCNGTLAALQAVPGAPAKDAKGLYPDDLYYQRTSQDPFLFVPNLGQAGVFHGIAGGDPKASVDAKLGTDFLIAYTDPNPGGISIYADPEHPECLMWIQYDAQDKVVFIVFQTNPLYVAPAAPTP